MEIRLLKYFLTIAEEENITKAAAKLNMSQPPLSRQLQLLEEELGAPLFRREKKKMVLTEEGRFLKSAAVQILELTDKTKEQISQLNSGIGGTIYIGATETTGSGILSVAIAEFKKKYKNTSYHVLGGHSSEVMDYLEKGLVDLAIIIEPYNQNKFDGIRLKNESWIALMHKDHALAQREEDTVTLKELGKEELIVTSRNNRDKEMIELFEQYNIIPKITYKFSPLLNGILLTNQNLGICILPETALNITSKYDTLIAKKIIEPSIENGISLIRKKHGRLPQIEQLFWEDFLQKYPSY